MEVARKDKRMTAWCQDVSDLTGENWRYLKVGGELFDSSQWDSVATLARALE